MKEPNARDLRCLTNVSLSSIVNKWYREQFDKLAEKAAIRGENHVLLYPILLVNSDTHPTLYYSIKNKDKKATEVISSLKRMLLLRGFIVEEDGAKLTVSW